MPEGSNADFNLRRPEVLWLSGVGDLAAKVTAIFDWKLAYHRKGEAVDVLVSDIGLPDATGHDLMRKVRAAHDVPGIAVSGFGMDTDLKNSRDAGFATHITKPVDLKQLDVAIRAAVRAAAGL